MSHSLRRPQTVGAAASAVLLMAVGLTTSASADAVGQPAPGCAATQLFGISMASSSRGWTVGGHRVGSGTVAVIRELQGGAWVAQTAPHPGDSSFLFGVGALSPTEAFAVGQYTDGSVFHPYALEWNGTRWSEMHTAGGRLPTGGLYGVSVISASDAWAVGTGGNAQGFEPLLLHWDGQAWRPASLPNPPANSWFNAVSATSATDVWAVGTAQNQAFAEHWDGSHWVRHDQPISWGSELNAVDSGTAGHPWAVGWYGHGIEPHNRELTLSWNGTQWLRVPGSHPSRAVNMLMGVSQAGAHDVWAVGTSRQGGQFVPLAEHWDGTQWSDSQVPAPAGDTQLYGVATVSAQDAWAVGGRGLRQILGCVIEHWDGHTWSDAE